MCVKLVPGMGVSSERALPAGPHLEGGARKSLQFAGAAQHAPGDSATPFKNAHPALQGDALNCRC